MELKHRIPTTKSKGDPIVKIEFTRSHQEARETAEKRLSDFNSACIRAKILGWNKPENG